MNKFTLFDSSGKISLQTGSTTAEPSFVGTMGSFAFRCRREDALVNQQKSPDYFLANLAETKLKGLWYFDENSLPRMNIYNPYNLEPRFEGHPTDTPVWDSTLNRWKVYDGKKIVLGIGNFGNHSSTELVRGITIAIDFRLMTSPPGFPMQTSATDVLIATLSSDIKLGILIRGSDRRIITAYMTSAGTWSAFSGTATTMPVD